jgi:hypothetical protein
MLDSILCLVLAPVLNKSCQAVSATPTSITFTWSAAKSADGATVTYSLSDGTRLVASSGLLSATIGNLTAASNYSFSLAATTNDVKSTSNLDSCTGWTGEFV